MILKFQLSALLRQCLEQEVEIRSLPEKRRGINVGDANGPALEGLWNIFHWERNAER